MTGLFTSKTAREYAKEGRIEEWIHLFLYNEGNNIPFSDGLKVERRSYNGPLLMPLNLFNRCCGPEENMKYRIDKGGFEWRVSEIRNRMETGWDTPPLIINFSNNIFELNDGNHRYQAMIDNDIDECDVIVWTTGHEDQLRFIELYGCLYK